MQLVGGDIFVCVDSSEFNSVLIADVTCSPDGAKEYSRKETNAKVLNNTFSYKEH